MPGGTAYYSQPAWRPRRATSARQAADGNRGPIAQSRRALSAQILRRAASAYWHCPLVVEPEFIVADEPVSALDVSVQAQIINLIQKRQEDLNLAMLFITHDLASVRHIADQVAVMYLGRIVETAPTRQMYTPPRHPYTEALLSAAPNPDPEVKNQRIVLKGMFIVLSTLHRVVHFAR